MLTVLKSPPLVALTGNPVRFRFQTDNHLEQAGEKIFFTLQFTNGGTGFEDDWIELRWNGRTVRMTCKPSPDESGTQVYDNSYYDELYEWVNQLAKSMSRNYYLSGDFVVTVNGSTLQLTAKELGQEYAIECETSWTSADKPVAGISGSNQKLRPYFKIGLQVLLKTGET